VATVVACLLTAACIQDDASDYCDNHYRFHDDHLETTAFLTINMADTGVIESEAAIPASIFGDNIVDRLSFLRQAKNVYTLDTERECQTQDAVVRNQGDRIIAHYESRCGSDNKLGQLEINIFDAMPELEEIEVIVTTSATSKRFAINRQCDSAIFRLDRPSGN
jgi:hypothetical protein